jgi:hypothetical protein
MLLSLNVLNPSNDKLILELTNPEKSGFTVRHIDGIGPTKSNINVYDVPSIDGGLFNSARTQSRNIVIKLGYMFITTGDHVTPTIEDARHLSYKYFPLKRKIRLEFITDYRTLYIDGYIESNEPDIFSKDEVTTISVICPDPNFYASDTEYGYINYTNQNEFEFPFDNNSLSSDLIEFSSVDRVNSCKIDYHGDNETGVTMELYFDDWIPKSQEMTLSFINKIKSTVITIDPNKIVRTSKYNLCPGSRLIIKGRPGYKGVEFRRLKKTYNVFNAITLDDDWPILYPGENTIVLRAGESTDAIKGRLIYNTLYDGV